MVPEIWKATDRIFSHFGPFFALLHPPHPPNNQENQNFENMKKKKKKKKKTWTYHHGLKTMSLLIRVYNTHR